MSKLTKSERRARRAKWASQDGYDSWQDYVEYAAELSGKDPEEICGAAARKRQDHKDDFPGPSPKKPCQSGPVEGMTRCRHHGGKSLVGAANPSFKTGEHSRFGGMPKRLRDRAERALKNPNLISVREHIAANDALILDLYDKLDSGEATKAWEDLRDSIRRRDKAMEAVREAPKDTEEERKAKMRLGKAINAHRTLESELVEEGLREAALRREVREAQDHGRKLRDTERKLLAEAAAFVRADQLYALADRFVNAAIECIRMVPEHGIERAISELRRMYDAAVNDQKKDPREIVQ